MQWFHRKSASLERTSRNTDHSGRSRVAFLIAREPGSATAKYCVTCWTRTNFLSPYGIRALSRVHQESPYHLSVRGAEYWVNTNRRVQHGAVRRQFELRGPIWFPVNYLLIESLQKFHYYLDDSYTVEFPTGSGHHLRSGMSRLSFHVACPASSCVDQMNAGLYGGAHKFQDDPHWNNLLLFYEYFMATTPQASARATKLADGISSKIVTTKRRVREKRKVRIGMERRE